MTTRIDDNRAWPLARGVRHDFPRKSRIGFARHWSRRRAGDQPEQNDPTDAARGDAVTIGKPAAPWLHTLI